MLYDRCKTTMFTGCWEFQGTKLETGYGRVVIEGRKVFAHRLAYSLKYGPIPEGMQVLHSCDNPPCCNPNHLFLGTQKDNMADMRSKGRQPDRRGQNAGGSVLTDEEVMDIYTRAHDTSAFAETQTQIGDSYGVSNTLVSRIKLGRRWNHITNHLK